MYIQAHTTLRTSELFGFMQSDHERLDAAVGTLIRALKFEDREATLACWGVFERDLLAHMEAEERYILPSYARREHEEAVELVHEHGQLRQTMLLVGVAIDLQFVRLDQVRDLLDQLRRHARREALLLYPWAEASLGSDLAYRVLSHVGT